MRTEAIEIVWALLSLGCVLYTYRIAHGWRRDVQVFLDAGGDPVDAEVGAIRRDRERAILAVQVIFAIIGLASMFVVSARTQPDQDPAMVAFSFLVLVGLMGSQLIMLASSIFTDRRSRKVYEAKLRELRDRNTDNGEES